MLLTAHLEVTGPSGAEDDHHLLRAPRPITAVRRGVGEVPASVTSIRPVMGDDSASATRGLGSTRRRCPGNPSRISTGASLDNLISDLSRFIEKATMARTGPRSLASTL